MLTILPKKKRSSFRAFEKKSELKQVTPAAGVIKPDQIAEVSVHLEDFPTLEEYVDGAPQNSWCEDTRDKEAILVIKVHGMNTRDSRDHRIRIRHCCAPRRAGLDPKSNGSSQVPGNLLPRSDYQRLSGSYDVVDHLRSLHSP